ncbi:MAG: aldehyde dehydrogenase family protein [Anaerolineales bacterium]
MDTNRHLIFTNPATGEAFGRVAMTDLAEVRQAVDDMRAAGRWWSRVSLNDRIRALRRFQEVVIDARDEITAVITQGTGKSRQDALATEVVPMVDNLHEYCRHAPKWLSPHSVPSGLYLLKRCYVEYRPHGVVAILGPWNVPWLLTVPPVVSALLAGNTVVVKPSEVTPAVGVLIESLFARVPELAPFVRVVHGDGAVGAALVEARPDYVYLTGSTATGKRVLRAAAEHLIPTTLELGGKDPLIVLEDADVNAAARWAVWGAFYNAGQACVSVERAYIVEPVYDEFVSRVLAFTHELKQGYSLEPANPYDLGPMTSLRQVEIVQQHLDDAVAKGAQVLCGGKINGSFIEPTVIVNVTHDMLLMQDETFGPILPIMKVTDEAEAVQLANDSRFGLGASIWSNDIERAERVAHEVRAGSIVINDALVSFGVPTLPFGGVGESGSGRAHGREGLRQFAKTHAYVVSGPPPAWDIVTLLRKPGHYQLTADVLRLLFGVNLRQRFEPLTERLTASTDAGAPRAVEGSLMSGPMGKRKLIGAALGAIGVLATGAFLISRAGKRSEREAQ